MHGVEARKAADEAARALFGRGELAALDDAMISPSWGGQGNQIRRDGELPTVVDVLAASGVVASRSAARGTIEEGGAYVNNAKVTDLILS